MKFGGRYSLRIFLHSSICPEFPHKKRSPAHSECHVLSSCFSLTKIVVFCMQYEKYADQLTIISMTTAHKNNKSCLPVNNSMLVKKLHGQSQFGRINLHCFFRKLLSLLEQGPHVTTGHVLHYIVPVFL